MESVLVLYIPVLHRGYLNLFERHRGEVRDLYLLTPELTKDFFALHEEIRALRPEEMKQIIETFRFFESVSVLTNEKIVELKDKTIITATEEVSRKFMEHFLPSTPVVYENIFLRWDEKNVQVENAIHFDRESSDSFDKSIMEKAQSEAEKSSDWWRHVGAVLVKEGREFFDSHNRHVASEHLPYIDGDPRDSIKAGERPELATALHAEQGLIVEAARLGISLEGASLYLTNFPCTMCAKLVAYSGIKKVFFEKGSAVLDGERILKANGVELILVK